MAGDDSSRRRLPGTLAWLAILAVTVLVFYAMDHAVMALQGLPLNLDLTPAQ